MCVCACVHVWVCICMPVHVCMCVSVCLCAIVWNVKRYILTSDCTSQRGWVWPWSLAGGGPLGRHWFGWSERWACAVSCSGTRWRGRSSAGCRSGPAPPAAPACRAYCRQARKTQWAHTHTYSNARRPATYSKHGTTRTSTMLLFWLQRTGITKKGSIARICWTHTLTYLTGKRDWTG